MSDEIQNQQNQQGQQNQAPVTYSREQLIAFIDQSIMENQLQRAWEVLEQWNIQDPNDALAYVFAASIMRRQQNWQRSIELANKSLELQANFYPALIEKARVYLDKGDFALACHAYFQIYQQYPNINEYLNEWGDALIQIADFKTLFDVVNLQLQTQAPTANLYFRAGLANQYLHKHEAAIPFYEEIYKSEPNFPMLRNNLGAAYKETKQLDKALQLLEEDLSENPNNFMALVNCGSVLQKNDQLEAALAYTLKAIAVEPNYAIAYNNLCLIQRELQQFQAATASLEQAILIDPNYTSAKWNLAMSYLQQGRYAEGWQMHEYRWTGSGELRDKPHNLPQPEYDGTQELAGKAVFIWGEQGFGDAMQFARYLPIIVEKLKAQGAKVYYCCFGLLQDLFTNTFADLFDGVIINDKERPLPEFDYHLPLLKLPLLMNTSLETIPQTVPYLKPTAVAKTHWQQKLASDKNLKVGLVWTGSLGHQRNPYRAVGIDAYIPFKNIEGVSFYNLQFNMQHDVDKAQAAGLNLIDYTTEIKNFNQSAALIQELDLVITVCTSVSHLAGALGVPTWVLLDVNPHWVWLLEREDSPWYPHTKLYRQKNYRQWDDVLARVATDLGQRVKLNGLVLSSDQSSAQIKSSSKQTSKEFSKQTSNIENIVNIGNIGEEKIIKGAKVEKVEKVAAPILKASKAKVSVTSVASKNSAKIK